MEDRRDPRDRTGGWPSRGPQHPGYDNYPPRHVPTRRQPLPPLHPVEPPQRDSHRGDSRKADPEGFGSETARGHAPRRDDEPFDDSPRREGKGGRAPRKLTVTRVAAMRSRELTERGFATFQRAAKADGADKSGLTALTYATMANFAVDAAVAIALANTLFFAAASGEDKTKVALYLVVTIAPFAVIAPLIGPMLDRLQHGRRVALAASFAARAALAIVLVFNFENSLVLYPVALCILVLSKSFAVLKSAVTPRVLPPEIDLVRVNSRLTVFGLLGGTIGAGAVAAVAAALFDSAGSLWFAAILGFAGAYLSMRIPSWVEITEGEVPATLSYHGADQHTTVLDPERAAEVKPSKRRQPLGRSVVTGLWGNGTIRILTGFLTLYIAFVAKSTEHDAVRQAAMLGLVGAAAGIGNFAGNATGARMKLGRPAVVVLRCTIAVTAVTVVAAFADSMFMAAIVALVASCTSALAKVSLDASIQDDLPAESIASGFGRSETVLQLSWVAGGAMGVLLPTTLWIGFTVVAVVLALGSAQTFATHMGRSIVPGIGGGNRPVHAKQEVHHTFPGSTGYAQ